MLFRRVYLKIGLRASPRVKTKKSLYLKNVNPNELKVVFS